MKKIVLKRFKETSKNSYSVFIGTGRRVHFNSKRDMASFIRSSNKFISQKAFDIHVAYMDVWQEYQRCWFYFGHGAKESYTLHHTDQTNCESLLKDCEEILSRTLTQTDWFKGNPFPFMNLVRAISSLEKVIDILVILYKKRSQTAELYRMATMYQRLTDLENRVNNYAKEIPSLQILTKIKKTA